MIITANTANAAPKIIRITLFRLSPSEYSVAGCVPVGLTAHSPEEDTVGVATAVGSLFVNVAGDADDIDPSEGDGVGDFADADPLTGDTVGVFAVVVLLAGEYVDVFVGVGLAVGTMGDGDFVDIAAVGFGVT